jgi:hypothetical protein
MTLARARSVDMQQPKIHQLPQDILPCMLMLHDEAIGEMQS